MEIMPAKQSRESDARVQPKRKQAAKRYFRLEDPIHITCQKIGTQPVSVFLIKGEQTQSLQMLVRGTSQPLKPGGCGIPKLKRSYAFLP